MKIGIIGGKMVIGVLSLSFWISFDHRDVLTVYKSKMQVIQCIRILKIYFSRLRYVNGIWLGNKTVMVGNRKIESCGNWFAVSSDASFTCFPKLILEHMKLVNLSVSTKEYCTIEASKKQKKL